MEILNCQRIQTLKAPHLRLDSGAGYEAGLGVNYPLAIIDLRQALEAQSMPHAIRVGPQLLIRMLQESALAR